jgi:hypothetical protein
LGDCAGRPPFPIIAFNTNACGKPPCANDPLDWQHGRVQPDKTSKTCGTPARANDPLDWQRGKLQADLTFKTCGKPLRASDPLGWQRGQGNNCFSSDILRRRLAHIPWGWLAINFRSLAAAQHQHQQTSANNCSEVADNRQS